MTLLYKITNWLLWTHPSLPNARWSLHWTKHQRTIQEWLYSTNCISYRHKAVWLRFASFHKGGYYGYECYDVHNRFHNADGPAIFFEGEEELYYLHGLKTTKEYVAEYKKANATQKRRMLTALEIANEYT